MRNEECLHEVYADAQKFAENLGTEFSSLPEGRTRRVTRRTGERAEDEPVIGARNKFRIDTFYSSIDCIVTLIKNRFLGEPRGKDGQYTTFGLLEDICLLSRSIVSELSTNRLALPEDAFEAFASVYGKFIDAKAARQEYIQFASQFQSLEKCMHPNSESRQQGILGSMFTVLCVSGLRECFPNLFNLIHIAITLPITSVTTERSFSKLKLIKSRLRSTMENVFF
jgi:hypothetical protein